MKNRYKVASQWFQAIITLCVLSCFYISRDYFSADAEKMPKPKTPPIVWAQKQYWGGDETGFASGHTLVITNKKLSLSEGVVYQKNGVKVSFFRESDPQNIELRIQSDLPRFYTQIDAGTLLVEGNISSSQVDSILRQIQSS